MKNIFVTTLLAALIASAAETNLPTIKVTASAQTSESADIYQVLRAEPGVIINSQGGSQNDLSIRGSSFSGAGLSLGGLTLRNPQTEHFHAELPLPATLLSRPHVRTGLNNQGGHLVGTVGFDLLPMSGTKQFETGFGTDHRDGQSLLVQQLLPESLGIGVFAGRETAEGVDYPDNDFDRKTIGGHLQFLGDDSQVDLIIGHQEKKFGARGYYGVSDLLEAGEATEDTLVLLSAIKGNVNADYLRGGIAWHEFNDDYRLPELFFRNTHRSRVTSAFVDGRTLEVNGWVLGWRADAEEESIASASLGTFHRNRTGLSVLPQWSGDRLKITAGVRGEFFSDDSNEALPQAGAEYLLTDNLTAFASYVETVRQPSYTELNYNSPASFGNAGLGNQLTRQSEIGFKGIPSEFVDWKLAVFHRRSKDTIDWQRATPMGRWAATDIGDLDTWGTEARLGWYPAQNVEMQFSYTWLHKDQDAEDFGNVASRYALDYPEHLAQASLLWSPVARLEIGTVQTLRWQTENAARTSDDFGADSSFVVRCKVPKADYATVSLLLNNAWNDDFQALPGQRPPERYAGVSLTLNF